MSDLPATDPVPPFFVTASTLERQPEAEQFARQFGYEFRAFERLPAADRELCHVMDFAGSGIALLSWYRKAPGPVSVDFTAAAMNYRRLHGGGRGESIAKAVGLKGGVRDLHILDATGGLGRDAFVLSSLGCRVSLYERHPVIHALLADGLQRGIQSEDPDIQASLSRIQLSFGEANWETDCDVIYLDPMFPQRQKSGQVKKEMQVFKSIVGPDADADSLLPKALSAPVKRVVVKRPKGAPYLNQQEPTLSLQGKSGRFDIYALRKLEDG